MWKHEEKQIKRKGEKRNERNICSEGVQKERKKKKGDG